jgi:dihydropteroate synthase
MNLHCGSRVLDLTRPVVMGVLNVTPDSFSDGGHYSSPERALGHARDMVAEGAAIIDVGGESTRPGATPVSPELELQRVLPVVRAIASGLDVVISVDTSSPEVMRAAVAEGAHLINDVRALQRPGALEAAAATSAGICLMHMQGEPADMQRAPAYSRVVEEVRAFLTARMQTCLAAGIARERLCIDPGFGFGKRVEDNLELLRRLGELRELGVPVLAGLSRKSMLSVLTGRTPDQRLAGSLALACVAAAGGASIIRAHDVAATVDVLKIVGALQGDGQ